MPTVLRIDGYEFYFYSNEGKELPHIHVDKAEASAKFWLLPQVQIVYNEGFTRAQLKRVRELVNEHKEFLLEKWNEYFSQSK